MVGWERAYASIPRAIPKPMIPVGYQPLLWHVMQYYSSFGHRDFILCLGYKANLIKEFFLNYRPPAFADCVVSGFGAQCRAAGRTRRGLARLPHRYGHLAEHWRASLGGS